MPEETKQPEPRGLGEHSRGLAGEYAHELGWGLEEDQRTRLPTGPQDSDGGTDYEYGARDFGDEPVNTAQLTTVSDGPNIADNPAVPEKESMKHHGDPLDHDPETAAEPTSDALPAGEDNTHPHSPVAP